MEPGICPDTRLLFWMGISGDEGDKDCRGEGGKADEDEIESTEHVCDDVPVVWMMNGGSIALPDDAQPG